VDFDAYLETVEKNRKLWHDLHERARVPTELVEDARDLPRGLRLLAISEDWCGDAVNVLPVVSRWVDAVEGWELRVVGRDDNPELMDDHLTRGSSRSIPVIILLDEELRELGWWGPRPRELQAWVMETGLALDPDERYRHVRRWFARDRGRTTLRELLELAASVTATAG
jgi:hypothetical protein